MPSTKKVKKSVKKTTTTKSTKKVAAKKTTAKKSPTKKSAPKKIKRVSEQAEATSLDNTVAVVEPVVAPIVQPNGTVVVSPVNAEDNTNADLSQLGDQCCFTNER